MGVNMVGNCISDDTVVREASKQEIIRRYYTALCDQRENMGSSNIVHKLDLLMKQANLTTANRRVVAAANEKAEQTENPVTAIELPDGTIVTGKTSSLLGASAAMLLNALKCLAGIGDEVLLIPQNIIEPVQHLKVDYLHNRNPRLHTDEVMIVLSICAVSSPLAAKALEQLDKLKGCEVHSSVILSEIDVKTFKKLGINLTCEPTYQINKLYHAK